MACRDIVEAGKNIQKEFEQIATFIRCGAMG